MGLTGGWSQGKYKKYAYYRCGNKCNHVSIKVSELEDTLVSLLKQVTPKKECLALFLHFLYKTYHERLSRLTKIRNSADDEIIRLKGVRKQLVEKNLSGVYSDEIFKEQTAVIESQIGRALIVKEDATFDNYNIDALTSFLKTLLADLGVTYKRSNISQVKVLLSSIFLKELAWDYNGGLNSQISPIYQAIRRFDDTTISSCADERS
jgi:hypothetical protein